MNIRPRLAYDHGSVDVLDIQLLIFASDVLPVHVYIIPAPSRINALLQAPSIKYFSDACTDLSESLDRAAMMYSANDCSSVAR